MLVSRAAVSTTQGMGTTSMPHSSWQLRTLFLMRSAFGVNEECSVEYSLRSVILARFAKSVTDYTAASDVRQVSILSYADSTLQDEK
jgi:hypothetical protein